MSSTRKGLFFFILVGTSAAGVHLLVVKLLVEGLALAPLLANVAGWAVAFWVSFAGHRWLTFGQSNAPFWPSLLKFATLSWSGFVANEACYALALRWWPQHYDLVLAAVLVLIAVGTYVLSRWWAFAHQKTSPSPASGAPRTPADS